MGIHVFRIWCICNVGWSGFSGGMPKNFLDKSPDHGKLVFIGFLKGFIGILLVFIGIFGTVTTFCGIFNVLFGFPMDFLTFCFNILAFL